mgnify:CR=1 FL=1
MAKEFIITEEEISRVLDASVSVDSMITEGFLDKYLAKKFQKLIGLTDYIERYDSDWLYKWRVKKRQEAQAAADEAAQAGADEEAQREAAKKVIDAATIYGDYDPEDPLDVPEPMGLEPEEEETEEEEEEPEEGELEVDQGPSDRGAVTVAGGWKYKGKLKKTPGESYLLKQLQPSEGIFGMLKKAAKAALATAVAGGLAYGIKKGMEKGEILDLIREENPDLDIDISEITKHLEAGDAEALTSLRKSLDQKIEKIKNLIKDGEFSTDAFMEIYEDFKGETYDKLMKRVTDKFKKMLPDDILDSLKDFKLPDFGGRETGIEESLRSLNEEKLVPIVINFSEIRSNQLDESWLAMFGGWVEWLLGRMFGTGKIPGKVVGTKREIESFATAMGSEKRYIETAKRYGLDHPTTYKNKSKLNIATKGFEKETGIKWPFE